jgi:hypothetical protein
MTCRSSGSSKNCGIFPSDISFERITKQYLEYLQAFKEWTTMHPFWAKSGSSAPGPNNWYNGLGALGPQNVIPRNGYYSFKLPDPSCDVGYRVVVVGIGETTHDPGTGGAYHYGTTGNLISGAGSGRLGYFNPNLTSAGGGDWQTVIPWDVGGQPGEGFHPVSPDLF